MYNIIKNKKAKRQSQIHKRSARKNKNVFLEVFFAVFAFNANVNKPERNAPDGLFTKHHCRKMTHFVKNCK